MKNPKPFTVSIGIPCYNEEANIGDLIKSILAQKAENYVLEKIIVASDNSTDNTISIAKSFHDQHIVVFDNKDRTGPAKRTNQIFEYVQSDCVIILNADILIKDPYFIEKLTTPIRTGKADLTSPKLQQIKAKTFIEQAIEISMQVKRTVFEQYHQGDNIYTCCGVARAFSKQLYKKLHIEYSVGEDAYSYLFCKKNHFQYRYVPETSITYKSPDTMEDHQRQSIRFLNSQKFLAQTFGKVVVQKEYHVPLGLTLKAGLKHLIQHPVLTVTYVWILGVMKIKSYKTKTSLQTWEIAKSSKQIHI